MLGRKVLKNKMDWRFEMKDSKEALIEANIRLLFNLPYFFIGIYEKENVLLLEQIFFL